MNFFEWFFSKQCPLCCEYQRDNNICFECFREVSFLTNACKKCQEPFDFNVEEIDTCQKCIEQDLNFYSSMKCAVVYNEFIKNLIIRFKNQSDFFLSNIFAKFILNSASDLFESDSIIIPIPLFYKRLIWRGYNQSYVLAKKLAYAKNIELANNIIFRIKDTNSQALKKFAQRHENMKDAFAVYDPRLVKNKKFIIVDDVITTGATVFECANKLHEYGAKKVDIIAVARRIKDPAYKNFHNVEMKS